MEAERHLFPMCVKEGEDAEPIVGIGKPHPSSGVDREFRILPYDGFDNGRVRDRRGVEESFEKTFEETAAVLGQQGPKAISEEAGAIRRSESRGFEKNILSQNARRCWKRPGFLESGDPRLEIFRLLQEVDTVKAKGAVPDGRREARGQKFCELSVLVDVLEVSDSNPVPVKIVVESDPPFCTSQDTAFCELINAGHVRRPYSRVKGRKRNVGDERVGEVPGEFSGRPGPESRMRPVRDLTVPKPEGEVGLTHRCEVVTRRGAGGEEIQDLRPEEDWSEVMAGLEGA
jgi:hypothetical protein